MKNILIKIGTAAAAIAATISCTDLKFGNDFLEKAPGVDVTIDTIFSSKLYAERALVGAYASLRTGLTEHNDIAYECIGSYEFQKPGNKLGWDNLDSMTDIIQSYCTWGGTYKLYYNGTYNAGWENAGADDPNGLTKFGYNPDDDATWKGIRRAYLFIENVDRVPDMSDALKKQRKAEAKMIIACHFHELLRHMGGVPLLYRSVDTDKNEDDYSRRTVREVADFICQLCDEAAGKDPESGAYYLPWDYINSDDNGRFTRAAALALKCRVLDFIAAPLFNSDQPYWLEGPGATEDLRISNANLAKINVKKEISDEEYVKRTLWLGGYSQKCWQDVIDACEDFFKANEAEGNTYKLNVVEDDPRASFSEGYGDRKSPEIIIHTCRTHAKYGNLYHIHYFGPSIRIQNGVQNNGVGYGGGCVTLDYVDKFTDKDGNPALYADWLRMHPDHLGNKESHPFLNRDPRLYESVMTQWDDFQNRTTEMYIGGRDHMAGANATRAATGFNIRKYMWDYNDATLFNKVANYAYLRLSEIYLIYAEALNEIGGHEDQAFDALNQTRRRVGLPDMDGALLSKVQKNNTLPVYSEPLAGNPQLREEILDERAREFCFEEVRWFDIIRWKRDDIFMKSLRGITMEITQGYLDSEGNKIATELNFSEPWKVEQGPIPNDRYWRSNFKDGGRKWFFSAFPTDEINKGYGLVQNPGWDVK